jgi:hypothetical protein
MTVLMTVGIVELVLFVGCVSAVAGHAAWLRYASGPRNIRITNATAALGNYFESGTLTPLLVRHVRRLSRGEQVEMFSRLAGVFGGQERVLLCELAEVLGLVAFAERRCRSRIWSRRLEGVRLFTLLGGGEAVVPPRLDDRRAEVRAAAAEWAAEHPEDDVVDRLVSMLDDPSTLCRFTVKDSLLRLRTSAIKALVDYLASAESPSLEALEVAAWISDREFLSCVDRLRDHPDERMRAGVIDLVASAGDAGRADVLETGAADASPLVRAAALRGIGRLQWWQFAPLLLDGLSDAQWTVRRQAGGALDALGAPGTLLLRQAALSENTDAADMAKHMLERPS